MKSNVAIVCILKNEYSLIPSWICWHKHLGFHDFIIFDDGSTDGSREFLEHAKTHYHIDIHDPLRFDQSDYMIRQQEAYKWAIKNYRDKYEWLLFIDADEFISFNNNISVEEFLRNFDYAHAIAVNWCQYGANGHIIDPNLPTMEAYTRHGPAGNLFSSHVKSFIRPDKVGEQWINVHCFDIAPELYFDASGNRIEWSSTPGISGKSADWSVAKIMHYQVRSMQSFIERVKRRKDLSYNTQTFFDLDTNQIDDPSPFEVSIAVRTRMEELLTGFNKYLRYVVHNTFHDHVLDTIRKSRNSLTSLKSHHGTVIVWNKKTVSLCHIESTKSFDPDLDYVFAILDTNRRFIFIFSIDSHPTSSSNTQAVKLIDFAKVDPDGQINNPTSAITNIIDSKFYSSELATGIVTNDKEHKKEWELFTFDASGRTQIGTRSFDVIVESYLEAHEKNEGNNDTKSALFLMDLSSVLEKFAHLDKDDCIFLLRLFGISKEYSNIIYNNIVLKRNFGLDV